MAKIIKYSISFIVFSIIISLCVLYFNLLRGISINNVKYKFINIGKLYIKIDKKIILNSKNIYIITKKDENKEIDFQKTNNLVREILKYLSFFQEINIQNFNVDHNKINLISLQNNIFSADTKDLSIQASIVPMEKKIGFKVYKLNIKKYNLVLKDIKGSFYSDLFHLYVNVNTVLKQGTIKVNLDITNEGIKYEGKIYNITKNTLFLFKDKIKDIKRLHIKELDFKGDEKKISFKTDLNLNIDSSDVETYLNGIYNIKNNKAQISLNQTNFMFDKMLFSIPNIILNTNLKNTNIKIDKVLSEDINVRDIKIDLSDNNLTINANTNSLLSLSLNKLLSKFNINIPIYQVSGQNRIEAIIKYNLKTNKNNVELKIKVNKSKLFLSKGVYLGIKTANLHLLNNKIYLKNSVVDFNQSIVNVNYFIKNGLIDLDKMKINTKGKIKDLNITNIVNIENYPENMYINLNKLNIKLENLKTDILIDNNVHVKIGKLSIFYPYIKYLSQYGIKQGNVDVEICDKINIYTNITELNQTILANDFKPFKKLEVNTTIDGNNVLIQNPYFKVNILSEINNTIITGGYKNLDINVTQFVDKNSSKENNKTIPIKVDLKAINTNIIYNDIKLFSKKLSIYYTPKQMNIESIDKDRNITITKNNGILKIYGLHIKEKTFKALTHSDVLKKPKITFFALKTKDNNAIQGFLDINGGYIKELKAFNNVIAFINLIPALVTFQHAGFSSKGYKIKEGHIEYILYKNILYLKTIDIMGSNLGFNGNGYIDLKKKTIKLNVDVNLIVKLIKDIPIVNYILLGKNGAITIKLRITGDLKNPKIHKNTVSNIIRAPFGIIKRMLLTPFRPFMEKK